MVKPETEENRNKPSGDEDVTRFVQAAFVAVRRASLDKDRLFYNLSPELRGRIYRSPSASACELAAALHDDTFSQMVKNAASVIQDVARDHPLWRGRMGDDRRPVCVYAPSRAIREWVFRIADSGNVIFEFGDSLLLFLVKIAKVLGQVLEAAPDSSLKKLLEIDPRTLSQLPEPCERLRDLLASIAVCGHPGLAPSFETSPAVEQLASQLSTTMLFFVVSRAFVQHLSNDFSDASSVPAGLEGFEAQELFFPFEYAARTDQLALDLMARSAKREGVPNGIFTLAPFLFLHGTMAVQRTLERLEPRGRSLSESATWRAGLPTFASERLGALADSGPNGATLPSIIHRNGAWLGELLESLRVSSLVFIDRCKELGLAPGSVNRANETHAFWLTPMAYDSDGQTLKPFCRVADRARVEAIHHHLGQLGYLRPYVLPYKHGVVICYRSSLYLESARRLGKLLRAAGVDALHDELFVPPDTDWEPHLREAIASARLVVMLMSLIDLGSGFMNDLVRLPVMKEIRWVGESGTRLFVAGVSHLAVDGEAGANFRSMIDIARTVADGMWVRNNFPVFMVQSESGSLPTNLDAVIAQDVLEELAQTP